MVCSCRMVQPRYVRMKDCLVHAAMRHGLWRHPLAGGCCASFIRQLVSANGYATAWPLRRLS